MPTGHRICGSGERNAKLILAVLTTPSAPMIHQNPYSIRHVWSCENCGHEIETVVNPRINAARRPLPTPCAHLIGICQTVAQSVAV
jgi:hypothetical protein